MTHTPRYALFYDNHTLKAIPDMGANFDAEEFTDQIKQCGIDTLIFHARCNQGWAYYDTTIGLKHPSLTFDLFGQLADNCARKGIALTAYFNAGISHEEGLLHRDWTTLYFDGRSLRQPRLTPQVRTMCYNTDYRIRLIEMVKEVVQRYPVSGLMIDCLINYPCVCPVCVAGMNREGIDHSDPEAVARFAERSALRLAKDIADAAKQQNPHLHISNNYPDPEALKEINTYYDVIHLPASDGGYESMPVMAHYIRTLGPMPVINMTGRFYEWGDFGGLLPEEAIKSELIYGLANGMRPCVGNHFHPRGEVDRPVLRRIEKIYRELQTREAWVTGAIPQTDVAIVYPKTIHALREEVELRSAVRMLSELKQQFDVVTHACDWSRYRVLIFPDSVFFCEETARRVNAHLEAGKTVIASGVSGLNPAQTDFALSARWGVVYRGKSPHTPAYVQVDAPLDEGLPQMPLSLYSEGIAVEPMEGTSVKARIVKPYQNRGWDGLYAAVYNPPQEVTSLPELTLHGGVAHFSHQLFRGYHEKASVELRTLFENVLNTLHPAPMLKLKNSPAFVRAFVTRQPGRRMVHLLAYLPEMRGKTPMIEEGMEVSNIRLLLHLNGPLPQKVYLAPDQTPLPFVIQGEYIETTVPHTKGYSLVVFETI